MHKISLVQTLDCIKFDRSNLKILHGFHVCKCYGIRRYLIFMTNCCIKVQMIVTIKQDTHLTWLQVVSLLSIKHYLNKSCILCSDVNIHKLSWSHTSAASTSEVYMGTISILLMVGNSEV
jgi:hypothetical protein